jgi:predicted GIY-YIG superfamily endonuclease
MATKKAAMRTPHHCVYVIELDPAVRLEKKFAAANPNARKDKPCLYVGLTGLTPEERFANHKAGKKASAYVKKYGLRLRPKYFEGLNPMTYEQAQAEEPALAERLRKRGFAVWQN